MMKRLIAATLVLSVAVLPSVSTAQVGPTLEEANATPVEETEVPVGPRLFQPVNFNVQEDLENILVLDLSNGQRVSIRLMPSWAPEHVKRIKELTRQGFYDGVIFHRVIDGFMAQTGDPTGTGQGGSDLPDLKQEFNPLPHVRGTVSMARAQSDDSANSQFFIVFYPRLGLDRKYTNFGRVIAGMPGADVIERGEPPANPTRILQASLAVDGKAPPVIAAPQPEETITLEMLNNAAAQQAPVPPVPAPAE